MYDSILISGITVLIGGLITYVLIRKTITLDRMMEYSDVLLDELTSNAEMQKKVYLLGVLLGNGVKTGMGLAKGKGKFGMNDLIGMGIAHFFGKGKGQEATPNLENIFKAEGQ